MAANRQGSSAIPEVLQDTNLPVILILVTLVVGIAALLPLVQTSLATSTGGNVSRLEQLREDWQARLHEQEVNVARLGSLDRIESEAQERLKMVAPDSVTYLRVDAPAPAPQRIPSRYLSEEEGPVEGESLWEEFFGWLPLP
ncbi:MAG: hypothetical protein IIC86_05015 [Chloroflexi bacterium]|nr:hypothetical protein [Chloroflexota bacterium]